MKVGVNYFDDRNSFLSIEKDFSIIIDKLLNNDTLMKLLYYTQKDCLAAADLSMDQKQSMLNKNILLVPKINIDIDGDCPNYLIIQIGNFESNKTNPEFLDCEISFDILCHADHWNLGNFRLRPYRIAGEINQMFNNKKLTGIGTLQFMGTEDLVLNGDLMGLSIMYKATHGIEDKINPLS